MLKWGMLVYDSLYAWCREAQGETHGCVTPEDSARRKLRERRTRVAPRPPTRAEAFRYWLKLGFVSFGGPAGQIAIMHHELVDAKRWISERRFLHALNYCMVLPGPEAQQLATYIGWLMHRTWGGIVAGALFVLPSLVILIALSWLYMAYGDVPAVAGILYGDQARGRRDRAARGVADRLARAASGPTLWVIAAAAFVAIFAFAVPFPGDRRRGGRDRLSSAGASRRGEFAIGGAHDAARRRACVRDHRRRHADAGARAIPRGRGSPRRRRLRRAVAVRARRCWSRLRPGRRRCRGWAGSSPRRRC